MNIIMVPSTITTKCLGITIQVTATSYQEGAATMLTLGPYQDTNNHWVLGQDNSNIQFQSQIL